MSKYPYLLKLRDKISNNEEIYIDVANFRYTIVLDKVYGCGGSKCAYKINNDSALILPNLSTACGGYNVLTKTYIFYKFL